MRVEAPSSHSCHCTVPPPPRLTFAKLFQFAVNESCWWGLRDEFKLTSSSPSCSISLGKSGWCGACSNYGEGTQRITLAGHVQDSWWGSWKGSYRGSGKGSWEVVGKVVGLCLAIRLVAQGDYREEVREELGVIWSGRWRRRGGMRSRNWRVFGEVPQGMGEVSKVRDIGARK